MIEAFVVLLAGLFIFAINGCHKYDRDIKEAKRRRKRAKKRKKMRLDDD